MHTFNVHMYMDKVYIISNYHQSCIAAGSRFNAGSPKPGT